eukprot:10054-Pelagococcus_subviridis.AAC.2
MCRRGVLVDSVACPGPGGLPLSRRSSRVRRRRKEFTRISTASASPNGPPLPVVTPRCSRPSSRTRSRAPPRIDDRRARPATSIAPAGRRRARRRDPFVRFHVDY